MYASSSCRFITSRSDLQKVYAQLNDPRASLDYLWARMNLDRTTSRLGGGLGS